MEFVRKHLGKPKAADKTDDPLAVLWKLRQQMHALGCVDKLDNPYANCRFVLKRKKHAG